MKSGRCYFCCAFFFLMRLSASEAASTEPCNHLPKSLCINGSHIQGDGIGYQEGYTSLGMFLVSPYIFKNCIVPFFDLNAILLNDGMPAVNAGVGVRFLSSRIWGVNTYYDYRDSHKQQYNQVTLGLESLGKIWDFRINGYLPVGSKVSDPYDFQITHSTEQIVFVSKYEFALKGFNTEAAVHFNRHNYIPLYFALGPYYLTGEGATSWGGSMRLVCSIASYVRLEGSTSYDTMFGWVGQGRLSLSFALGFKKQEGCKYRKRLLDRAVQPVDQYEIIALKTAKKTEIPLQ